MRGPRILSHLLMRLYGTSQTEQDELTRRTAEAVCERAEEREREIGSHTTDYSRAVVDAYRNRVRRGHG